MATAERLYAMRESHLLGASLALILHGFVHPYAAAAYVLVLLMLWLWSVTHSASSPVEGDPNGK